jgi:hypothetical protein
MRLRESADVNRVSEVMRSPRNLPSKRTRSADDRRSPSSERVHPERSGERRERVRKSIDKVLTEHSDLMAKLAK